MELQLGLSLHHSTKPFDFDLNHEAKKESDLNHHKRTFHHAFGGDDGDDDRTNHTHCIEEEGEEEEKRVIGWPPIQTWRRNLLCQYYHDQAARIDINRRINRDRFNYKYVKVQMEGVGITRKVNVTLYNSFRSLKTSLIAMFGKYRECEKESVLYTLTYQDMEGDWLLAEDVPWRTFLETVQRLKILRNGG